MCPTEIKTDRDHHSLTPTTIIQGGEERIAKSDKISPDAPSEAGIYPKPLPLATETLVLHYFLNTPIPLGEDGKMTFKKISTIFTRLKLFSVTMLSPSIKKPENLYFEPISAKLNNGSAVS